MLETHSSAWSRAYNIRNSAKGGWEGDSACPIRLRGYTELVMGNIDPKLRKKIDTAVRRGYMLESRTQLPMYLSMFRERNPIGNIPIGYIGKTAMTVYLPDEDSAKLLEQELQALLVMTEAIKNKARFNVIAHDYSGYWILNIHAYAKEAKGRTAHLLSAFNGMRPVIDEALSPDAHTREKFARWCADDATTIRIPFDSHKGRK